MSYQTKVMRYHSKVLESKSARHRDGSYHWPGDGESCAECDAGERYWAAHPDPELMTPQAKAPIVQGPDAGVLADAMRRGTELQQQGYGRGQEPVCAKCRAAYAPGAGTVDGKCAHYVSPAEQARRAAVDDDVLARALQHAGDPVPAGYWPVVSVEAEMERGHRAAELGL